MSESEGELMRVRAWHREQLGRFMGMVPALNTAAAQLGGLLRRIADEAAPEARVGVRVKTLSSVSEKMLRGDNARRYKEPLDADRGMMDLVGGRIVPSTRRDRDAVCRLIERLGERQEGAGEDGGRLEINAEASGDTEHRLLPDQFGYTARHYIIRLHGSDLLGVPIDAASGCGRWMEVQVVPAISQAWGELTHDRTYKVDLTLPARLHRRVAEAKALLDTAERQLEEAIVELDRYRKRHAGRLWSTGRGDESLSEYSKALMAAEGVLAMDLPADDPSLHRSFVEAMEMRGELAMASGEWGRAIECFERASSARPRLRVRLAEAHQHDGDAGTAGRLLDALLAEDPVNLQAACARAELILEHGPGDQESFDEAARILEAPFLSRPEEPEALMAYCTARLLRDRDAARLCTMRGTLRAAIAECRKREELGSDVPECLLQQARLALFADELFESVHLYCLASMRGTTRERMMQELRIIGLLRERVAANPSEPRVGSLRVGLECVQRLLELLCSLEGGGSAADSSAEGAPALDQRPIVIVAGACGSMDELGGDAGEALLTSALRDFGGTIISGGTDSGISGIIGRVAALSSAEDPSGTDGDRLGAGASTMRAIGYLPPQSEVVAHGDRIDSRYSQLIHVIPEEPGPPLYSPLAPIRVWSDLLRAGVSPGDVRLLGLGGGDVSGFEYRLALAVRATVGILDDPSLPASGILSDHRWNSERGLVRMIADPDTIRFFVDPGLSGLVGAAPLDDAFVQRIGRTLHENYRSVQINSPRNVHPSVLPWESLDAVYRASSLQQARTLGAILASEGFEIVPETDPREPVRFGVPDPGAPERLVPAPAHQQQLDRMARLEHARWNAERLSLGWRHGPTRSLEAKTSPYLVSFDALPREVQRYDYDPFLSLPESINSGDSSGHSRWKVVRTNAG
ncbi:MAG: RyR domain-containing protein [Phycisphaerales bacterium]